jgi:hypothetical protein
MLGTTIEHSRFSAILTTLYASIGLGEVTESIFLRLDNDVHKTHSEAYLGKG